MVYSGKELLAMMDLWIPEDLSIKETRLYAVKFRWNIYGGREISEIKEVKR